MDKAKKKPWTKEQCEERYIYGDRISLRQLAEISGRSFGTLGQWSKKASWESRRKHFNNKVKTETAEKVVEKISDRLSDQLSELAIEHFEAYKVFRQVAQSVSKSALDKISEAQKSGNSEEVINILKREAFTFNQWSLILDRSLKGEALATGLHFEVDLDAAAAILRKRGYEVSKPQEEDNTPALIVEFTEDAISSSNGTETE